MACSQVSQRLEVLSMAWPRSLVQEQDSTLACLKSGMPHEVLIPAPVNATMLSQARTCTLPAVVRQQQLGARLTPGSARL